MKFQGYHDLRLSISCCQTLKFLSRTLRNQVRLNEEKYGGAIVPFNRELYEEHEAYAKTLDECQECWALSSLQLLEITHSVVTMEPFDDGSGDTQVHNAEASAHNTETVALDQWPLTPGHGIRKPLPR